MPYTAMDENTATKLTMIAKKAKEQQSLKFISLMHLLNFPYLKQSYKELKRGKAAGIDRRRLESYSEQEIDTVIQETIRQIKTKKYQPQPVRRVYIQKENGKARSLGIPTVIDKVVGRSITGILEQIYEATFLPLSYGFRRGKRPQEALKAVNHMIMQKKINYIIDADIEGFFDHIDHKWMMRCISQRIKDPNFKRLIKKFLKAGVMEEGKYITTKEGTPQGGNLSPMLANIYLHYVLDLWFEKHLKRRIQGYSELVRYADDFLIGVQNRQEAEEILKELKTRFEVFGLTLAKEKTKVIEFGRFASENQKIKGNGKPKTFDFLGFTHYCSKTQDERFMVKVKTSKKRMNKAVISINVWLKSTRNLLPTKEIWKMLALKLTGHYQYYGVSGNVEGLERYYHRTLNLTFKWLNRRSRKKSWNWD